MKIIFTPLEVRYFCSKMPCNKSHDLGGELRAARAERQVDMAMMCR